VGVRSHVVEFVVLASAAPWCSFGTGADSVPLLPLFDDDLRRWCCAPVLPVSRAAAHQANRDVYEVQARSADERQAASRRCNERRRPQGLIGPVRASAAASGPSRHVAVNANTEQPPSVSPERLASGWQSQRRNCACAW
jgi:hypothetical protein